MGCTESTADKVSPISDAGADAATDVQDEPDVASDAGDTDVDADVETDIDEGDVEQDTDADIAPNCVEDQCGVCDDDPTNDCVQDCNQEWGGSAVEDECGSCNADPADNCVQDCAGTWGGAALPDNCGVCDEDPGNDCVEDCAGTWGGSAVEDACGTCDADPSNDCDCAGTPGGSAAVDNCGTCDADASNDCVQDCAGDWGGSATLDGCGTCDANPLNDCIFDCNGVPAGAATLDNCGTCDSDPSNDCAQDCAGDWGGPAAVDQCGTCDTDPSNDCAQDCAGTWGGAAVVDQCGTCDADASNDCTQDCNGDWGGSAEMDLCGRCVDGNTGAQACPTLELTPVADASVRKSDATSNYGTSQDLSVHAQSRASEARTYLRFDLSGLPASAVVQGVRLEATAYKGYAHGGDGNVYTHFVGDDAWGETTVTWDNAPTAEPTRLGHWWLWYNATPATRLGVNNSAALAAVVQREHDGDKMVSLRLHSPGYDTTYRSREYSNTAERPKLRIGYLNASTTTLEPSADAWTEAGSTLNNGGDTSLEVMPSNRGERNVYVRFDLNSLPAGAKVVEATFSMTAYKGHAYGGNGNVYTHLVSDDSWTEGAINAMNAPPAASDSLGFWWLWYNYEIENKVGRFSTEALRDAVQGEFDDDGTISFRLHSSGYKTSYRSREYSVSGERPQLTVKYVIP
ncbi:hypothetical protein DN745_06845 [Bradymonas sediminis]|uniref:Carbohydrate-binding module family 96 domain-containing protein n=1 Tax=Bradymonas sediminis TaxID=1548548 RepID=A0A2Z4FK15_9DELT|nr:hypothetical protein DN745_06845 [Bradymonas sediminis]